MHDSGHAAVHRESGGRHRIHRCGFRISLRPEAGDVVTALDGDSVPQLVERWAPFYAASNQPTRLHDIAASMTRGACGAVSVRVSRDGGPLELKAERTPQSVPNSIPMPTRDRPGETFQRLSPEIAYLKLSSVKASQAAAYIEAAVRHQGHDHRHSELPFGIRGVCPGIASRRSGQPSSLASRPAIRRIQGPFTGEAPPLSLMPAAPRYTGKIVDPRGRVVAEPGRVHDDGVQVRAECGGRRQHDGGRRRQCLAHPAPWRTPIGD